MGRNDPCPCGSGRRYKHCCGEWPAGRPAESAPCGLQRSAGPSPESAGAWVNLGNTLARAGRLEDALAAFDRALALDAGLAEAHNGRGNVLGERGCHEEALSSYGAALRIRSDYAEVHDHLGGTLLELGRIEEAARSLRRALALNPRLASAHHRFGLLCEAQDSLETAIASHRAALALAPRSAEFWTALGNALHASGEIEQARSAYHQALALEPRSIAALHNLGSLHRGSGELEEAADCFERAVAIEPTFIEAHASLGLARRLEGRTREAQACCQRALALDPRHLRSMLVLAEIQADLGDFEGAERSLREVLVLDRTSARALAGLTRLRRMTGADREWLLEAERVLARGLPPADEAILRHAMAKYFDDLGEYSAAFRSAARAHSLTRTRRRAHDAVAFTRAVDRLIETHDRAWLETCASSPRAGPPSPCGGPSSPCDAPPLPCPVFVVGMLRSGTSLAEQILASHPDVFGAGELAFWGQAAAGAAGIGAPGIAAPGIRTAHLDALAGAYLQRLTALAPSAMRVVDKMPGNFLHLGLIHAALPQARIIHMRRDPLDTCLSIYLQHFERTLSFSNDLGDLASYYEDYARLMRHWREVLPSEVMLEISYEALVDDPERESRRMLEHVGLSWNPCCLEFHTTPRTVITASQWQVRQPLSRRSIGRARYYEEHLGPLWRLRGV